MEIRKAESRDRPALRDVARRSLQASYPLEPKAITGALEQWYSEESLSELLDDEDHVLLVADLDGQVVAFSDARRTGENTGELYWFHVDPDYRSENYGKELFDATREHLESHGVNAVRGRVLAVNEGGNAFYRRQGLTKVGEETVDIDGTPYVRNIYTELEKARIEEIQSDDGPVYADHHNTERGSLAPFSVVYTTEESDELYGYWCRNCNTLANAMDAMGRIQCDNCGNTRKATRWDAAYL